MTVHWLDPRNWEDRWRRRNKNHDNNIPQSPLCGL